MANNSTQGSASAAAQEAAPKGTELEATLMLGGAKTVLPPGSSVVVNGQKMTQAQLVAALEVIVLLFTSVEDQQLALDKARAARKVGLPGAKETLLGLKAALMAFFGPRDPLLAKFGIRASKRPPALTSEQKALRAAKAKLTRAARHTLGKKKKLEIQTLGTPTLTLGPDGSTITPPAGGGGSTKGNGGAA